MTRLFARRFVRQAILSGGAQVSQAGLAMIAGILVARHFGASAKGTLSVLLALGSTAVLLGSLGVHNSSVYTLATRVDERDSILSNVLALAAIGGVITFVVLSGVVVLLKTALIGPIAVSIFLVFAISLPFNYFNQFAQRAALGLGNARLYNLPYFTEGIGLVLGVLATMALFGNRVLPLVVFRVATEVLTSAVFCVWFMRRVRLRFKLRTALLRDQIALGLRSYAATLFWLVLLQGDLVLCNHYVGSAETGVYSVSVSLGLPITMTSAVVGPLLYQRSAGEPNRPTRIANANRLMRLLTPLVLGACVLLAALTPVLVPLLYGQAFRGAIVALLILLPGLFALTLETAIMNFLGGEGYPRIVVLAPSVGLVINFGLNLFVIPRWGIDGAACTSSAAYGLVYVMVLVYYLRSTGTTLGELVIPHLGDIAVLAGRSHRTEAPIRRAVTAPHAPEAVGERVMAIAAQGDGRRERC
jgi:O-antigen/teichoic acid export membrane protein